MVGVTCDGQSCSHPLQEVIPQTDLSVGVLAVLVRGAHEPADEAETLPGTRFDWFLQYKMDLTLKNTP